MPEASEQTGARRDGGAGRRWLSGLLIVFAALSVIEMARLAVFASPGDAEVGLYDTERAPSPRGRRLTEFRWTAGTAALLRRPAGPVLTLPFYAGRPDLSDRRVSTTVSADGHELDRVTFTESGWQERTYYLPPVVGEMFEAAPDGVLPVATGWLELRPWAAPDPRPLWLTLVTTPPVVPASIGAGDDRRELGIGLGELRWSDRLPEEGVGFHPVETSADGVRFRWTSRLWASRPLAGGGMELAVRADHPDLEAAPVEVALYWNERRIGTVLLADHAWRSVPLTAELVGSAAGVLSLRVDRTWSPAAAGTSSDARQLGVAVALGIDR